MAESADSTQDIFHPIKRTKSEVWAYFVFLKNAEGQLVEENDPVCRTCKKKVVRKAVTLQIYWHISMSIIHSFYSQGKVSERQFKSEHVNRVGNK